MASLRHLNLGQTQVTAQGVADLKKSLPNCNIIWDDPSSTSDPDRAASEP
jgi:hypothetical protein